MKIIVTSENGDKMAKKANVSFKKGKPTRTVLKISLEIKKTNDGWHRQFIHRILCIRTGASG